MPTRSRDTRSRLIEATSELIWSGGFRASSVDEICRSADVHKGSFYHFFPSKMDLAIEALRANWQDTRDTVFGPIFSEKMKGMERLRAVVDAVDRLQRREFAARHVYLGCPFGNLGQEMANQDERLQSALDEVFAGHVDYFQRALEEAAEAGECEPGDLRNRARRILALMEGALLVAKVANQPDRFTEVMRAAPLLARADPEAPRSLSH